MSKFIDLITRNFSFEEGEFSLEELAEAKETNLPKQMREGRQIAHRAFFVASALGLYGLLYSQPITALPVVGAIAVVGLSLHYSGEYSRKAREA
ncbi:MAG: hypothetical protein Q7K43_05625 [Candidatus Woesearchaeota archaeon]|nr:hypothetical protein [Candidatus Woesearchaeota archaeon]